MKKFVLLAVFVLSCMASVNTGRIDVPLPRCNPCPLVR
jgi:hypothetical protein